ncbi:autotransporter outer membrane beta-barrel domain-containing protein [Bartonella rattaustraliani]|uniref:autotransporter family protein n=1 Tax=Bartonella rattaustraliani TaxID=481139 RepID=UPI000301EA69|nr:autotransporter outer membrane beta-barrel domain-containing protein [Bartonella rattaustraliani]
MIKVFRNHVCLCTFTTAILSLLQHGVGFCENRERSARTHRVVEIFFDNPYTFPAIDVISYPLGTMPPPLVSPPDIVVAPYPEGLVSPSSEISVYKTLSGSTSYGGLRGIEGDSTGKQWSTMSAEVDPRKPASSSISGLGGNNSDRSLSGMGSDREGNSYIFKYGPDGKKLSLYDGLYYLCDNCGEGIINSKSYNIMKEKVSNYPSRTAITVRGKNAKVIGKDVIVGSGNSDETFQYGVSVSQGGKIVFPELILKNADTALYARDGFIGVYGGNIEGKNKAIQATGASVVVLEDVNVKVQDGEVGFSSYDKSKISMRGGSFHFKDSNGVSATLGGKVTLDDVSITGEGEKNKNYAALRMDLDGSVSFSGTLDVTHAHGVMLENTVSTPNSVPLSPELSDKATITEVNVKSSTITVRGEGADGIYFRGEKRSTEEENPLGQEDVSPRLGVVNLSVTEFSVFDGVAIHGEDVTNGAVSLLSSTLRSRDFLLKVEGGASVTVLADSSTLEGRAYTDGSSFAELYLGDNSVWKIQQMKQSGQDKTDLKSDSSLSRLSLMGNSAVDFTAPKDASTYEYQTLRIGNGKETAYKAQDGAHIYFNTYLNEGGSLENQKTDRLLIHGDVTGKTTVHVRRISGSPGGYTGSGGNNQGISLIQVSGSANANSFQLEGDYATLEHSPYQYGLYAYGPSSDLGEADPTQRLVAGTGKFWDFRLENKYIDPRPEPGPAPSPEPGPAPGPRPEPAPKPHPDPGVKAVVPQVPTYLLLPNALFQVGLMNIGNQSRRLEALRIASEGEGESGEKPAFFMRGYGGSHRYSSNLSRLEYGYGGELDYSAVEAGLLLKTIENAYSTTSLGVIGTYDRFLLQPLDVKQSQKSAFNKWLVTAYGSMQYDTGLYVDALLSYGLFNGDVTTLARGKTATLKGKSLSTSFTVGETLAAGNQGLVFDPHVQLIYQQLYFDKVHDIDNFDIEMEKLDQWVMRVGGRLTKDFAMTEEAHIISFYGKLHLAHGFKKKQLVHFKDAFQLGALGSAIEAGLGFNAQLSQKIALYGDLIYQHKITKAGFSGTSVSGGLRYHF